ncbi:Glycosyltransferase [Zostera marina]|uniref:Glycosyltransferase n=1 Tax=Zostera marina TaxID=29655 RepID=A0A0K9P4P2_ZOSMR|nr:Glycosyltransferase [Zostera marina]
MKRQLLLQHPHHHRPTKLLFFLFTLFSVVALALLALTLLFSPLSFREDEELDASHRRPYCPNVPDGFICCDRTTSVRSDVCVMRGDIRTRPGSKSIHLYNSKMDNVTRVVEEIRPYTRKWETSVMSTIDQLRLVAIKDNHNNGSDHRCDVMHDSPALVFSTGGYTGNVYHEFNDGIIPLYITSRRFDKKVVFVIVEYHDWWVMKYGNILSQMSYYDPIDFSGDNRTHCFPEVTVGLKIHDELTVESENNMSIANFRNLLDEAYRPRIQSIEKEEEKANRTEKEINSPVEPSVMKKPRLVIVARNGSRGIDNEEDLVNLCEEIGFDVVVIQPTKTTELAKIYRDLNGSDAMIGVHGAAMTHLLFMRPKTAFIQIVPLGTEWAAEAYYGEPARKLGLKYVEYRIVPRESSLYEKYPRDDPVLKDPSSVAAKGWEVTKEVYLDGQSVRLDLNRFLKRITRVYQYAVRRKNTLKMDYDWSWQLPTKNRAPARKEIRKMKKKTILFYFFDSLFC